MKHLRRFNTISDYNSSAVYKPSVSLIASNISLIYDPLPFIPSTVTIGGVKWATCNVGATKPEEYGLYFQWGDTVGYTAEQVGSGEGKKYFGWADYKYSDGGSSASSMTKYNSTDGKKVLDLSDDAANAAYGGNWRMPTYAESIAFREAVTAAWTTDYKNTGVAGIVFTDKADPSKVLFFPATGCYRDGRARDIGTSGDYWSGSLSGGTFGVQMLAFEGSNLYWVSNRQRYQGYAIRGVLAE